ncbi:hypothetical protein [Streptomyces radicis]|uniref:hypothetical protein n=1 Tax=Streptomyces radicis TaxID=1750517 RepID=UPI001E513D10|nr:hypothetical protein [Streptomyces radicis]
MEQFSDRDVLELAEREGRLMVREEVAAVLRIRLSDADHLVRSGRLRPTAYTRGQFRAAIPLYRAGDVSALERAEDIDWMTVRATPKGRRSRSPHCPPRGIDERPPTSPGRNAVNSPASPSGPVLPPPPLRGLGVTAAAEAGDHSIAGLNARASLAAHLADRHFPQGLADDLLAAVEAGGVASARTEVQDLFFEDHPGKLERIAQRTWDQRDGLTDGITRFRQAHAQKLAEQAAAGDASAADPGLGDKADPPAVEGDEAPTELIERVLAVSARHYTEVTGTDSEQWDEETSRELVGIALRTVRLAEREDYPRALEEYLRANRVRLGRLWQRYGPDGLFPRGVYHLVELPEVFVLCERIESDRYWLSGVWSDEGQEDAPLERLEEIWLYGTGEWEDR